MLRVRGESMIELGILDGDFVVATQIANPNNGDIVVAGIPGGEATIKTYSRSGAQVTLTPANSTIGPHGVHGRRRRDLRQGRHRHAPLLIDGGAHGDGCAGAGGEPGAGASGDGAPGGGAIGGPAGPVAPVVGGGAGNPGGPMGHVAADACGSQSESSDAASRGRRRLPSTSRTPPTTVSTTAEATAPHRSRSASVPH